MTLVVVRDGVMAADAETAMRLGLSADSAVELAIEMCGELLGPVQIERIDPPPGERSVPRFPLAAA